MIDIDKIKEYTGGDDDFIGILFDKFLARLDDDLSELQNAVEQKDWKGVRSKTHAMLSSARIFFLEDIIELSNKIEQSCEDDEVEDVPQMVDRLITLYQKKKGEVQAWKQTS